ncbi:MAG: hypothetical protein AB3N14_14060 [Flavobacteriaceae bacterium]
MKQSAYLKNSMKYFDQKIYRVLRKLDLLVPKNIVPMLLKLGYDLEKAHRLIEFLKKNGYADIKFSNEFPFKLVDEALQPVKLEDLEIMALITPEGQNYLRDNSTILFRAWEKWKMWLIFGLPSILLIWVIKETLGPTFNKQSDSITFTVFVHGLKGEDDIILKDQGRVTLMLNSDKRTSSINEKGEATFKEIPSSYNDQKVKIYIDHPEPYRPVVLDSFYKVQNGKSINLQVKLYNTERIYGTVIESQGEAGLDSVRVSIRGIEVFTNANGYYELEIPLKYQKKFQNIKFEKKGFSPIRRNNIPVHTDQPLDISMEKINEI